MLQQRNSVFFRCIQIINILFSLLPFFQGVHVLRYFLAFNLFINLTSFACTENGSTGIIPPNDMYIPANIKRVGGITRSQYDTAIEKINVIYSPIFKKLGSPLVIRKDWDDGTVNAYATIKNGESHLILPGGLPRHSSMSVDAFTLVLCHEVGHHIGGYPKKDGYYSTWASSEGQADYFGTLKCLRRVFLHDNNEAIIKKMNVPTTVSSACESSHGNNKDKFICIRSAMAGKDLGRFFAGQDSAPRFETPDRNIVYKNDSDHPMAQCRLDTFFQGALCDVKFTEDVSQSEEARGTCHNLLGYKKGLRPHCWFKPSEEIEDSSLPRVITTAEGKYHGQVQYVEGKPLKHGTGTMTYSDGAVCTGEWHKNLISKAKCTFKDGTKYEGNFMNGYFNGEGRFTWASGSYYEGNFKKGSRTGRGFMKWVSGETYDGDWVSNQMNGLGTYKFSDGRVYTGHFKDDSPNGFGKVVYPDGYIYEGDWVVSTFHGKGVYYDPEGYKYEGDFENNKFSGRGVFYFPNGAVYFGEFKNDMFEGQGVMRYVDGTFDEGLWSEDEFQESRIVIPNLKISKISNVSWTSENLSEPIFRNGDSLVEAKDAESWKKYAASGTPAFYRPNNSKLGFLYNNHAIKDPRGLAPKGWRIPHAKDWESLCSSLGGAESCSSKLKSSSGWLSGGSNTSGFSALAGGYFSEEGLFEINQEVSLWWTSSIGQNGMPKSFKIDEKGLLAQPGNDPKHSFGQYVRLIKD
jgi:uncharacterized protein (TIGR02145 family)